jgi:ribonuclease P protein component
MLPEEDSLISLSFKKKERISSRILLQNIIAKGTSLFIYPIKCYVLLVPIKGVHDCNQIAISVPKRNFKNAVDRNRIKRIIRETYRLNNKHVLLPSTSVATNKVALLFVYVGKVIPDYKLVERVMVDLLKKVSHLV